jgi:hypothetical protein
MLSENIVGGGGGGDETSACAEVVTASRGLCSIEVVDVWGRVSTWRPSSTKERSVGVVWGLYRSVLRRCVCWVGGWRGLSGCGRVRLHRMWRVGGVCVLSGNSDDLTLLFPVCVQRFRNL